MTAKIFGREPAAIVGAVQAVLALLLGFGLLDVVGLTTQEHLAIVMGAVGAAAAVYLAYVTSETLLAPVIELLKAALAVGAIYGVGISLEQTALLVAAITAGFGLWQRGKVVPLSKPTFARIAPSATSPLPGEHRAVA